MSFFSIIIPTYNRADTIIRALDSVISQKTSKSFEIILVDDGSYDNTKMLVHSWMEKNNLNIKYLFQTQEGVSSARNLGVKNSSAEWICFLDSDDEWLPSKLEAQLQYIQENPKSRIFQTEEIWIRNGIRVNPHAKHKKCAGSIFLESLEQCMITTSSVAIRRDLWEETNGFDPEILACEDYDLWLQITCKEEVGLVSEKLLIRYGGGQDQLSIKYPVMDRFRIYSILKNWTIFTEEQKNKAANILFAKLKILVNGLQKRGKDSKPLQEIISSVENFQQDKADLTIKENIFDFLLNQHNWNKT